MKLPAEYVSALIERCPSMQRVNKEDVERYVPLQMALSSLILWQAKERNDPYETERLAELILDRNKEQYREALQNLFDGTAINKLLAEDASFIKAELERNPPSTGNPPGNRGRF